MAAGRASESSFLATITATRPREELVAFVGAASSGNTSDAAKAAIAEIELLIRDGDAYLCHYEISAALYDLEKARAAIYRLLHPAFDLSHYLASSTIREVLPVSREIENSLISLPGDVIEAIRPQSVEPNGAFWVGSSATVPANVAAFTELGLRDASRSNQFLQLASERGAAMLVAGRPEAALTILDSAVSSESSGTPAMASIHLNRAAALLQIGEASTAIDAAKTARANFTSVRDIAGMAQATHLMAIGLQMSGNTEAQSAFSEAAQLMTELPPVAVVEKPALAAATLPLTIAANAQSFTANSAAAVQALSPRLSDRVTRDPAGLVAITQQDPRTLTVRLPGRLDGWSTLPLMDNSQVAALSQPWNLTVLAGTDTVTFGVSNARRVSANDLIGKIYAPRVAATSAAQLGWSMGDSFSTTLYLNHLYGYVLPLKIGDCYHARQLYSKAEEYYLQAARYSSLSRPGGDASVGTHRPQHA